MNGLFFFFKQKTAYEMRISDWSSDVCSSDLDRHLPSGVRGLQGRPGFRRRTDRLRRGPPPPHSGWHAAWPPEAPEGASLEPGRSPARRPLHLVATGPTAGLARPEAAEAPSKPLPLFRPKKPRGPNRKTVG